MKILYVNNYDISGGAAQAAYRLYKGMSAANIDAEYLVARKHSKDRSIRTTYRIFPNFFSKAHSFIDKLPLKLYSKKQEGVFSQAMVLTKAYHSITKLNPDIIHLHWIAGGFMRIEDIAKLREPILWTLHDMWAFTGGCHYDNNCEKYKVHCCKCPSLGSSKDHDLSYINFQRKQNAFKSLDLTIITPSNWLAECAKKSKILGEKPVHVIPGSIDINIFRPIEKSKAKKHFGLPLDSKIIMFGAMNAISDKRKGYEKLTLALDILFQYNFENNKIVVFGSSNQQITKNDDPRFIYFGYFKDPESLSMLYSAADVIVVPSIQENLSNVVLEALSCGTPVVAFNIGGMPDMIEHKISGYLARPHDPKDLAAGINWVLNEANYPVTSNYCRNKAINNYSIDLCVKQHLNLYSNVLNR